ncbi:sodium:proton exchanger [Candidatus Parcubacteria bacterium]|nr:MAG: sodium:proton exchanger [Candidatus Parcubacteria bacterium]
MELFAEISILIAVAAGIAAVMRILHQPLIIGHIATGLIVGPSVFNLVSSEETLALMGQIGVAILLFTVGLHLSPDVVRQFGRVAFLTGVGQVLFTSIAGFAICVALGMTPLTAFYVSVALAFSSTIIIMKLIADKGDLEVLYAKIAIGFLLVQDLIAVLLLLGIPILSTDTSTPWSIVQFVLTGIILIGLVLFAAKFVIARANRFLAQSQEFLFLFSLTWGMGIAALFHTFGFSLESGALIAGVALAALPSRHEISARLTPLRDFFIVMFFIFLGAQMHLGEITALIPVAIILSFLVLVGNPLILMIIMGYLGYRRKTSLQTGFTVAQISEFSLILVALGVTLGHVESEILSLVTLVGLITIFGSTYLVLYSDRIYKLLAPYLGLFERTDAHEQRVRHQKHAIILLGSGRIGFDFLETLKEGDKSLLIVDYDPDVISELERRGFNTLFGDAGDFDFLDTLDFSNAELIVSTIPDPDTNMLIQRRVKAQNKDAVVMVLAHRIKDALSHYDEGVDYVILPHFLGGKYAAELVIKFKDDKDRYSKLRKEHIDHLKMRVTLGHEHPVPGGMKI